MTKTLMVVLSAIFFAAVGGCAPNLARLDDKGIYSEFHDYKIRITGPEMKAFQKAGWRIDNFYRSPLWPEHRWEPKIGPNYLKKAIMEYNYKDVRIKKTLPEFDLAMTHSQDDGELSVSSYPQTSREQDRALDVYVERLTGALSGSTAVFARTWTGYVHVKTRDEVALVTEVERRCLGSYEALIATVDFENMDVRKLDPSKSHVWRTRLVILRFWGSAIRIGDNGMNWAKVRGPALLVARYGNTPTHFDKHLPAFEKLLSLIDLPKPPDVWPRCEKATLKPTDNPPTVVQPALEPPFAPIAPAESEEDS